MYGHEGKIPDTTPSTKFINHDCEKCNDIRRALLEGAVCTPPQVECTHTTKETPSDIVLL